MRATAVLLLALAASCLHVCSASAPVHHDLDIHPGELLSNRKLLQETLDTCDLEAVDAGKVSPICPAGTEPDLTYPYPVLCYGPCKSGFRKVFDVNGFGRCMCVPTCPPPSFHVSTYANGALLCRRCLPGYAYNWATGACYAKCPSTHPWQYTQPPLCCQNCPKGYVPSPSNPSLCVRRLWMPAESDVEVINLDPLIDAARIKLPPFYVWRQCVGRLTAKPVDVSTLPPYPCPKWWATCPALDVSVQVKA